MSNKYKQTVSGTIGAGMKSVFAGGGKSYYVLEHKVTSAYHRAGEYQEIIVDQIEIGRDPRCQVRFDDSEKFKTVSRRHAAIVRDGENWKLVQLSSTNKTLLNGVPVEKEWFLQNGDEIQLSVNGPKLGFIIPQGDKATTKSIGLSRRLSLFRQQALRPYKTAMWIVSILLLLAIGAGAFFIVKGTQENKKLIDKHVADSLVMDSVVNKMLTDRTAFEKEISKLKKRVSELEPIKPPKRCDTCESNIPYVSDIYYLQVMGYELEINGEQVVVEPGTVIPIGDEKLVVDGWSGTGFLLNNGKFVTARHCVEGWFYSALGSDWQYFLNVSGYKVNVILGAISSKNEAKMLYSKDAMCNRSGDHPFTNIDGKIVTLAVVERDGALFDPLDFAWFSVDWGGGMPFDAELAQHLPLKSEVEIYGFPNGWGMKGNEKPTPIMSTGVVAREGLERGVIMTQNSGTDHGQSGAPVMVKDKRGKYTCVGIHIAGNDKNFGFAVPISQIK